MLFSPISDSPGVEVIAGALVVSGEVLLCSHEQPLMDQEGVTAFDAYHAAYAGRDPIASSDQAFDGGSGVERLPLEQER